MIEEEEKFSHRNHCNIEAICKKTGWIKGHRCRVCFHFSGGEFQSIYKIKEIPSILEEILKIDFAVHLIFTQFNYLFSLKSQGAALCLPEMWVITLARHASDDEMQCESRRNDLYRIKQLKTITTSQWQKANAFPRFQSINAISNSFFDSKLNWSTKES